MRSASWWSFTCETWLIHMWDMTHSYVRHDSFICATWLIHMCDMTHSYVRHDSFICATWLIYMSDTTHSYTCIYIFVFVCAPQASDRGRARRECRLSNVIRRLLIIHMCDSFICVTWLIPTRNVSRLYKYLYIYMYCVLMLTASFWSRARAKRVPPATAAYASSPVLCVCHDSVISATWFIHMCDMTHPYMWHDLFPYAIWLICMCATCRCECIDMCACAHVRIHMWALAHVCLHMCDLTHTHKCDVTHSNVRHDSSICVPWVIHTCDVTCTSTYPQTHTDKRQQHRHRHRDRHTHKYCGTNTCTYPQTCRAQAVEVVAVAPRLRGCFGLRMRHIKRIF